MEITESKEIANLCKSGVKGYNEMNGRIYDTDGVCPTIRANSGGHNEIKITVQKDNVVVERMPFRVRKLTPKECWRLMGFDDGSFERAEKVCSNSQLYRQAGNSIVVDVLMAIFNEML